MVIMITILLRLSSTSNEHTIEQLSPIESVTIAVTLITGDDIPTKIKRTKLVEYSVVLKKAF